MGVLSALPLVSAGNLCCCLWVIGGGAVYDAFLPHADRLVVTDVDVRVEGDTWAPAVGPGWERVARTPDEGWSLSSSSGLRRSAARSPTSSAVFVAASARPITTSAVNGTT